jgi:hypothetical protein
MADTIENVGALVERLEQWATKWMHDEEQLLLNAAATITRLAKENERLRKEWTKQRDEVDRMAGIVMEERKKEIERK